MRPVESSSSSMHWVNVWDLRPIGMEALKRDESLEYLDYLPTVVVKNCSMCTYMLFCFIRYFLCCLITLMSCQQLLFGLQNLWPPPQTISAPEGSKAAHIFPNDGDNQYMAIIIIVIFINSIKLKKVQKKKCLPRGSGRSGTPEWRQSPEEPMI